MHVVAVTNAAEVQAAVLAARERRLPLSVYATGHGTIVQNDGGVQINTSAMAEVLVDPDRRVAHVGPGARWAQVLTAAAPFGLAPLSGSSPSVGVTGYTLGGGMGPLGRRHGFAADHVRRLRLVTADGRPHEIDADRAPELFWALRGAVPPSATSAKPVSRKSPASAGPATSHSSRSARSASGRGPA